MWWKALLDFITAPAKLKACRQRVGELEQERNLLWQERDQLKKRVETLQAQNANLLGERQKTFAKLCDILGQTVVGPIDIPRKLQEVHGLVADLKGQVRAMQVRIEQLESALAKEQSRCGELRFQLDEAIKLAEQAKGEIQEWARKVGLEWAELRREQ